MLLPVFSSTATLPPLPLTVVRRDLNLPGQFYSIILHPPLETPPMSILQGLREAYWVAHGWGRKITNSHSVCVPVLYIYRGLGTSGFGKWSCMAHSEGLHISGGLHVGYCMAWDIIFLLKLFQSSWATTVLPALPWTSLWSFSFVYTQGILISIVFLYSRQLSIHILGCPSHYL